MPWRYHQASGALEDPTGLIVGTGYSGAPPLGRNNPSMQNVRMIGPIPKGTYTIGQPFDSADHGPHAMHLTQDTANEMFGRDGFLMHGDSIEHPGCASEGCIIMARPIRDLVSESSDKTLTVVG